MPLLFYNQFLKHFKDILNNEDFVSFLLLFFITAYNCMYGKSQLYPLYGL